jgi:hypothetical protein
LRSFPSRLEESCDHVSHPIKDHDDIPQLEVWDAEIEKDPWQSGRLRWIDGEHVYMFDHIYEKIFPEKEKKKYA